MVRSPALTHEITACNDQLSRLNFSQFGLTLVFWGAAYGVKFTRDSNIFGPDLSGLEPKAADFWFNQNFDPQKGDTSRDPKPG